MEKLNGPIFYEDKQGNIGQVVWSNIDLSKSVWLGIRRDMDFGNQLIEKQYAAGMIGEMRQRTKLERLKDMKAGLEAKLSEVNRAIEVMEARPDIVELIDALEKVNV